MRKNAIASGQRPEKQPGMDSRPMGLITGMGPKNSLVRHRDLPLATVKVPCLLRANIVRPLLALQFLPEFLYVSFHEFAVRFDDSSCWVPRYAPGLYNFT